MRTRRCPVDACGEWITGWDNFMTHIHEQHTDPAAADEERHMQVERILKIGAGLSDPAPDTTTHRTSAGVQHEGDEWDCGVCREALLEAFRPAADAPSAPVASERACVARPGASGPSEPVTEQEWLDGDDPAVQHDATGRVVPHPDRPGGTWRAACVCGWSKSGHYARDGMGELVAERLAVKYAQTHLKHPEAEL